MVIALAWFIISLSVHICNGELLFIHSLLRSRKFSASSTAENDDVTINFDQYGNIPQLDFAGKAISTASTVIAIRSSNSTLLFFETTKKTSIETAIGSSAFKPLSPHHVALMTGMVADTRAVYRYMKQSVLNHTFEYGDHITGRALADKTGFVLRSATAGSTRPYATHIILVDGSMGTIHEIDPSGIVQQVVAAIAGRGRTESCEAILNARYNASMTIDDAKLLVQDIITMYEQQQQSRDDSISGSIDFSSDKHQGEDVDSYRVNGEYVVIPHRPPPAD